MTESSAPSTIPPYVIAIYKLQKQMRNGANWFFWIAALSLINSVIFVLGSKVFFVVGLGITQVVDAFTDIFAKHLASPMVVRLIGFLIDVAIAGVIALFGVFARKGRKWAFIVGMVLYALDGLIFLAVQDWLSLGFHAFVLYGIFLGLRAKHHLDKIAQQATKTLTPSQPSTPQV